MLSNGVMEVSGRLFILTSRQKRYLRILLTSTLYGIVAWNLANDITVFSKFIKRFSHWKEKKP